MTSPDDGDSHVSAKPVGGHSPPAASSEASSGAADDQRAAASGRENDVRLWWVTFSASLASIVGGAVVLGISLVLIRAFRHLSLGFQQLTEVLTFSPLGAIAFVIIWKRTVRFYLSAPGGFKFILALYMIAALAGILMIIGFFAGVK